jgi:CSLREA domain-containing protein
MINALARLFVTSRNRRRLSQTGTLPPAEFLEFRRLPAQIVVTSLEDNTVSDNNVTLREAIAAANNDTSVDGSTAGNGADEIVFSANLKALGSTRILVSLGEFTITSPLTITGFGSTACVLDAQSLGRLFRISGAASAVQFQSIGLVNGSVFNDNPSPESFEGNGGAILHEADGTLSLTDCWISENVTAGAFGAGGAIYTIAECSLRNCVVQSNRTLGTDAVGGAIATIAGTLKIEDSIFIGNYTSNSAACGGAVYVGTGTATIQQTQFQSNSTAFEDAAGGAIAVGPGRVELTDCDFQYNSTSGWNAFGGAVSVEAGTIELNRVSMFSNSTNGDSSYGGAVGGRGNAKIFVSDSTFSDNSTLGGSSQGGALAASFSEVKLTQSTFSGNQTLALQSAGGAVSVVSGRLLLIQSTITLNKVGQLANAVGGGVSCTTSDVQIHNSIIAGNLDSGDAPDLWLSSANTPAGAVRNSLIGRSNGSRLTPTTGTSPDNLGNFVGGTTAALALDAKLNPLRANGGRTLTHSPRAESLAVNGGSNQLSVGLTGSRLLTDQRAEAPLQRTRDNIVDIGAVERLTISGPIVVSTSLHELDSDLSPGDLSLAEAVSLANANEGMDTIQFATQTDANPIGLSPGGTGLDYDLVIRESVVIIGNGSGKTIIDGGGLRRLIDITEDAADVRLEKIQLRNGNPQLSGIDNADHRGAGGAIRMIGPGRLLLNQIYFTANQTDFDYAGGGAVAFFGAQLSIAESTFENNRTRGMDSDGGAIISFADRTAISRTTFSANSTAGAAADGGAVAGPLGGLIFSQTTISGNSVLGPGSIGGGIAAELLPGALQPEFGILLSQSTVVLNNAAQAAGGGIASTLATNLQNSIVARNSTGGFNFNSVAVTGTDLWQKFESPLTVTASLIGRSDDTILTPTSGPADANGNFIGGLTPATAVDPRLSALANNGGPTKTHMPTSGSPAIDAGRNALAIDVTLPGTPSLTADQRGNPNARVLDGDHRQTAVLPVVDMGAAEFGGLRLLSPAPNAFTLRPTFRWTAIAGATSYKIHINNATTGKAPYLLATSNTAEFTPAADMEIGKFTMWIMPVYAVGGSVWSAPQTFNILVAPTWQPMQRTQLISRPTLSWNALPGAVSYDIWADNFSTKQQQTIRKTVTGTSWTLDTDLPIGVHRFWFRALDAKNVPNTWSALREFLVVPVVTPLTPGASVFDTTPDFTWQSVTGAASYDLTVRNASTNAVVLDQKNITATRFTPTTALATGSYKWFVFAVSPSSIGSIRSGAATTRDLFIGGRPTILAPSGTFQPARPEFRWGIVDDAVSYNVVIHQLVGNTSVKIFDVSGITTLSWTPPTPLAAGNYRAWVAAVSGSGADSWTNPLNFTIQSA